MGGKWCDPFLLLLLSHWLQGAVWRKLRNQDKLWTRHSSSSGGLGDPSVKTAGSSLQESLLSQIATWHLFCILSPPHSEQLFLYRETTKRILQKHLLSNALWNAFIQGWKINGHRAERRHCSKLPPAIGNMPAVPPVTSASHRKLRAKPGLAITQLLHNTLTTSLCSLPWK